MFNVFTRTPSFQWCAYVRALSNFIEVVGES